MKSSALRSTGMAAFFIAALRVGAAAAPVSLAGGSTLWLTGDSTLHVFHSTATEMRMSGEVEPFPPLSSGILKGFTMVIPVKGLKSGKTGLDQNLWKALKADENPEILLKLSHFAAEPSAEGAFQLKIEGFLTVAGTQKPVVLSARTWLEEGRVVVEGEHDLLMTDFGVKPPVMMMGAIKTKNEIKIHYRIFLIAGKNQQEASQ